MSANRHERVDNYLARDHVLVPRLTKNGLAKLWTDILSKPEEEVEAIVQQVCAFPLEMLTTSCELFGEYNVPTLYCFSDLLITC